MTAAVFIGYYIKDGRPIEPSDGPVVVEGIGGRKTLIVPWQSGPWAS